MRKAELRLICCDEKFSSSSKIHNHISGSIIAVSRCHISICPDSGKEWSVLSRGSYCIARINIDQPSDTKCYWDFETHWLCYRHLPCIKLLYSCSVHVRVQLDSRPRGRKYNFPPIPHQTHAHSFFIGQIPPNQPHFSLHAFSAEWAKIYVAKTNMDKYHIINTSKVVSILIGWPSWTTLAETGKLLFKAPASVCLKNSWR